MPSFIIGGPVVGPVHATGRVPDSHTGRARARRCEETRIDSETVFSQHFYPVLPVRS
jgi:hypothetical protein